MQSRNHCFPPAESLTPRIKPGGRERNQPSLRRHGPSPRGAAPAGNRAETGCPRASHGKARGQVRGGGVVLRRAVRSHTPGTTLTRAAGPLSHAPPS